MEWFAILSFLLSNFQLWSKLEIVLYTLFVLSCPTKLTELYSLYRPLRCVPVSLLGLYKHKWSSLVPEQVFTMHRKPAKIQRNKKIWKSIIEM